MDENTEFLKLPIEDRVVHKLWKARVSGYEEATKLFNQWDGDDPNWKKYLGLAKKFVTDSNAAAQEKGLEATLAFVENCDSAGKTVSEVVDGLVTKCLAAPKPKTKDLAKSIILMFCEIEQYEKVIEELIKGLTQKNPKTVAGCVNCMTDCLRSFGAKIIKVSPLLKAVVPLLDHRDKPVRDEGKALIVEAYRWVGEIMKQQLSGCKPVQMTELEAEFETIKGGKKAKPERLLRSQQQIAIGGDDDNDAAEGTSKPDDGGDDGGDEDGDPYDLLDPVEILEKLPKNFYELVEEKKWQLRKEALDALHPLVQNPKLASGDYNELVRVLKKFIAKDANVILVALAAQCLAGLAKGLRAQFKNGAMQCFSVVLEKFKEKKPNVVSALVEAVDALYPCLGIETVQEDCLVALKHKTPTVNSETAKFLARAFAKCPAPLFTNKKMLKGYVSSLLERLNHSDLIVRDAASEALGVLVKLLGEQPMTKLMPDLDALKLGKIKEFAEKAEITGKRPKVQPEGESHGGAKVVKPGQKKSATVVKPGSGKPKPVVKAPAAESSDDDFAAEFAPEQPSRPAAKTGNGRVVSAPSGSRKVSASAPSSAKPRPGTGTTSTVRTAKSSVASANPARKKGDDIDTSPPYVVNDLKNARFKDEAKLKLLKWNFATPRQEFVDQLKEQMTNANFNRTLMVQMFHADFKQHLKAIETLSGYINADIEGLVSNLDLILKWITLRFFETNPSVLLRSLDYLNNAFSALGDDSYSLHEIEAVSFIPYLINKVGDPKDQVRNSIRAILRSLRNIYAASKLSNFLMEGSKSKNAKQRAECLEDIGLVIRDYGINVLQPSPPVHLKEIAKLIADRDTSVRNAALNAITEAFFQTGEKIYKMIGRLPDKDLSMLEERIKRASLQRPPPGSAPVPAQQIQQPIPQVSESRELPMKNRNIGAPGGLQGLRYQSQISSNQQQPPLDSRIPMTFNRKSPQGSDGYGAGGRDRPISGVFTLDLEKIENSDSFHSVRNGGPELVSHNLDEIFGDDGHVHLPHISSARNPMISRQGPPPQTQMNLIESPEAFEALDVVLAQIMSKDAAASTLALSQIDELIKDKEKVVLLAERIDQLLTACYMQYRHVFYNKLRTDNANPKDIVRIFQYVTMVLMSIYALPNLPKNGSTSTLQDLLNIIICILVEPEVRQLPENSHLIRALNVLIVKMLDRSDHSRVTCAFIRLLKEFVGNPSLSREHSELVMKCLWRVIKMMPTWLKDETDMFNLDDVLAEVHDFFKAYPSSYWKGRDSDTPIRTIKTILHTCIKNLGDEVLHHLTKVQDPQSSELVSYLQKLLNAGIGKENANVRGSSNNNLDSNPDATHKNGNVRPGSSEIPRFSKTDEETLKEIFNRIGNKELTRQGLQDLYNFKKRNPHADKLLAPFLERSTPHFRSYIERGLQSIEPEMSTNILSDAGQRINDNQTTGAYDPRSYLDKLKKLRAQAGLGSNLPESTNRFGYSSSLTTASGHSEEEISSSTSSTITTATANTEIETGQQMSATELEDIQKRLARLKQSAR